MRLGAVAETPLEWLALASGRIPTPLVDTHLAFAWARTIMVATRLGVFEALADAAADAHAVASRCGSAPEPTRRLLDALTGMGYLRPAGADAYALPRSTRRWLTRSSPDEVVDKVLFGFDEWRFVEHYERFVRTGVALDMHASFSDSASDGVAPQPRPGTAHGAVAGPAAHDPTGGAWGRYQRGLHALSKVSAGEVARRTPVPRGATRLLDVGGAHGRFALALAERHPGLTATILDLPDALATWESSGARGGAAARVHTQAGDVFATDLGESAWDVVFLSQLSHHFDDAANRVLAASVARALKPGGVYVIQDLVRPASPREARRARLGALLDLYFAATSGAGTATLGAMRAWQSAAGLTPRPPVWMRTLPGMVQQVGLKPR